jgi:hypothetical protein
MTNLDAGTIALFLDIERSISAKPGGTLDLHISNRGEKFKPQTPMYVIGGVVPGIAYKSSEFESMDADQYASFIKALTDLIKRGEDAGAMVVGWWENDGIVYFDVSQTIDANLYSINLPLNLARKWDQQAIGLYLNGEYAHTINVV